MDGIRHLDGHISGSSTLYEILCEAVHPNWAGTGAVKLLKDERNPSYIRLVLSIYLTRLALDESSQALSNAFSGDLSSDRLIWW